ncbi:MAG: outer membrane beta-barrel protein [Bacteroidota bacterium]
MRKLLIYLTTCLASYFTADSYGQLKGVEIYTGVNYSFIGDQVSESSRSTPVSGFGFQTVNLDVEETYDNFLGYSVGSKAQFSISNKFSLKTGLGLDYIKFERNATVSEPGTTLGSFGFNGNGEIFFINDFGEDLSEITNNLVIGDPEKGPAHLVYLAVPLELSYLFSKRVYGIIGISFAARVYSQTKGDVISFDSESFMNTIEERTFTDGRGFNGSQWLATLGLGYELINRINVELAYNRGFTEIFEVSSQIAGDAKYNLLRLGASYQLLNTINKKQ